MANPTLSEIVESIQAGEVYIAVGEIERLQAELEEAHDLLQKAVEIAYTPRSEGNMVPTWLRRVSEHFKRYVAGAAESESEQ